MAFLDVITGEMIRDVLEQEGEESETLVLEGNCPGCGLALSSTNPGFGDMYGEHKGEYPHVPEFRCYTCTANDDSGKGLDHDCGPEMFMIGIPELAKHFMRKVCIWRNCPHAASFDFLGAGYRMGHTFFWDANNQEVLRPHFGFDEYGFCMPMEIEFEEGSDFVPNHYLPFRIGDSLIEKVRQEFMRTRSNIAELTVNGKKYTFVAESLREVGTIGELDPDIEGRYWIDPTLPSHQPYDHDMGSRRVAELEERLRGVDPDRLIGIASHVGYQPEKVSSEGTYYGRRLPFPPECDVMGRIEEATRRMEAQMGREALATATGINTGPGSGPANIIASFLEGRRRRTRRRSTRRRSTRRRA